MTNPLKAVSKTLLVAASAVLFAVGCSPEERGPSPEIDRSVKGVRLIDRSNDLMLSFQINKLLKDVGLQSKEPSLKAGDYYAGLPIVDGENINTDPINPEKSPKVYVVNEVSVPIYLNRNPARSSSYNLELVATVVLPRLDLGKNDAYNVEVHVGSNNRLVELTRGNPEAVKFFTEIVSNSPSSAVVSGSPALSFNFDTGKLSYSGKMAAAPRRDVNPGPK